MFAGDVCWLALVLIYLFVVGYLISQSVSLFHIACLALYLFVWLVDSLVFFFLFIDPYE